MYRSLSLFLYNLYIGIIPCLLINSLIYNINNIYPFNYYSHHHHGAATRLVSKYIVVIILYLVVYKPKCYNYCSRAYSMANHGLP